MGTHEVTAPWVKAGAEHRETITKPSRSVAFADTADEDTSPGSWVSGGRSEEESWTM